MHFSQSTDSLVLQELTSRLNPSKLLDLASDILSNRRHASVKITDGPGDGGRDLHSIDLSSTSWVTQCKFHKNVNQTCSSRELGELPLALVKRDLTHGLFITNARISPQAKREYLDDFPLLKLEFLDGISLMRELSSSATLSAIWLSSLSRPVTYAFPVIVRLHFNDSPYPLQSNHYVLYRTTLALLEIFPDIEVTFDNGATFDDSFFEPYRLPDVAAVFEGMFLPFRGVECRIRGQLKLARIPEVAECIAIKIAEFLLIDGLNVTVCVGTVTMTLLGGENAGARIRLDSRPQSAVATSNYLGLEENFITIEHPLWSSETDARTTEASWIRLYAHDIDVAVDVRILSPVSRSLRMSMRMARRLQLTQWSKSVQALLPTWNDCWPYDYLDEPDETVEWPWGNLTLCAWLNDCDWLDDISPQRVNKLKSILREIPEVKILSPDVARHMLGVLGNDPFPDQDNFCYDTADLSTHIIIPSPINPNSRQLTITICFQVQPIIIETFEVLLNEKPEFYGGHEVAIGTEWMSIDIMINQNYSKTRSTTSLLTTIHEWIFELLKLCPPNIKTETVRYWQENYGVRLGTSYSNSNKVNE